MPCCFVLCFIIIFLLFSAAQTSASLFHVVGSISVPAESGSSEGSVVERETHHVSSGTPSNDGKFIIEEPVSGDSLEVSSLEVGDSGGDLASGDSSVQVEELVSDGLSDVVSGLVLEELVEEFVSGSVELDLVDVGSVLSEDDLREVEHLEAVDLVSVEIGSEDTSIRVRGVDGLVDGDVGEGSEVVVDQVVLSVGGIEVVASVLVSSVLSEDSLVEEEGVVVGVGPAGGLEEGSDVDVGHFVVSDGHDRRGEEGLLGVSGSEASRGVSGELSEILVDELGELLVLDVSGSDDNDVLSDVVISVELLDHVLIDDANVLSDTENGLSHHVVSETIEVDVLDESLHLVLGGLDALSVDGLSLGLDLVGVVEGVAEHVSEDLDGLGNVVLEDGHGVRGVFSGGVGVELASHVLDVELELSSGSVRGSLEVEMLKEVSSSTGLDGLVSASALNEN